MKRLIGPWLPLAACAGVCTALALGGCGSDSRAARPHAAAVSVSERDFHISAPTRVPAGEVVLDVHNEGPDQHELIVVPGSWQQLPLRRDGITVDEEAVGAAEPGSLEPGEPGTSRQLRLDLKPGRYVFFCNMEGHFMGGMHAEVVVQ
jgi:uncharacterized cupredoxin-like copper-binding protein